MRQKWAPFVSAILLGAVLWWLAQPEPAPTQDPIEPAESASAPTRPSEVSTAAVPAASSDEAPPVIVTEQSAPADDVAGIELQGWIGDADGSGIGAIEIEIESRGFDGEDIARQKSKSNDNGEFRLRGIVPERQYKLEIRPQGDYAAFSLDSFTSENAEVLQNIVLQRIALVDADGLIVDTNHAPVADFELHVRSLAVEFPDRVIRSDSSGFFRLTGFPAGELRIATNASDYYRIKGIKLRPDEYRNLTLMIDRGSYHLSGWVGDDDGAPLEDVQLTLKSAFATDGYHSFSYRTTVTDANGGFEFDGLGGHRLTLGVYARGYESLIRQHDFESFSDRIELRLQRQRPQQDENDVGG